jgi:hypothetical protein
MAEKYFFEERNAKKAASKARTTARNAAKTRAANKPANKDLPTKKSMELVQKQFKQTNLDKTAGTRNKAGASTVAAVAKRFGVTAREARDIATALSTAATNVKTGASGSFKTKDVENIKRQVKETARAAVTGKKGTASNLSINAWPSKKDEKKYDIEAASYKKGKGKSSDAFIVKGKKRK